MKKQLLFGAMLFGAIVSANAQSSCADAVDLSMGITNISSMEGEYVQNCWAYLDQNTSTTDDDAADAAAWYKVTATANGTYRVNTNLDSNDPTAVDTRISVYHGTSCAALDCWGSSDDVYAGAQNDPNNNFLTDFQFPVVAGQTYYIVFDNQWMNGATPFDVELSFIEPGCTSNDLHENWENSGHYYFCWDQIDANQDTKGWTLLTDYNFMSTVYHNTNAAAIFGQAGGNDDYLISNSKSLLGGVEYTVTVKYNAADTAAAGSADESFEVFMFQLNDQNQYVPVGDGLPIGSETGIVQTGATLNVLGDSANASVGTYTFTPDADGLYNFGIHSNSLQAGGVLFIFEVNVDGQMGVNKPLASKLSVFPNPATNVINITNADNILVNGVQIIDLNGRTVKSAKFDGVTEAQVNISDLANGMYMMTVSSDKGTMTQKIVKN